MTLTPDYNKGGHSWGGYFKDLPPKPWYFYFPHPTEKRGLDMKITIWKSYTGNGHFHCDIYEDQNFVWNSYKNEWIQPWSVEYGSPYYDDYKYLRGRGESNRVANLVEAKEWFKGIITEWDIIGKNYCPRVTVYTDSYEEDDDPEKMEIELESWAKELIKGR